MLGTFNCRNVGRYIISGDTPEDFLWDLFDQIVSSENTTGNISAIDTNGDLSNYEERKDLRTSNEWVKEHCNYFCHKLSENNIFHTNIPPDLFFNFHIISLLGSVYNNVPSDLNGNLMYNYLGFKYGWGTPEYNQEVEQIPANDYPYEDYEPVNVINYLMIKGVLISKNIFLDHGIISQEEANDYINNMRLKKINLEKERNELAMANTKKKPAKPANPAKPTTAPKAKPTTKKK